ncbi:sensor histidine kinase [Planomonospora parontospora]|uniref:sensor histidine kinase n=2 Tax=Planomonospora parontospora TaxID=58119 RepID=UPI0016709001|nr:histidine kinase [Planomonospora parontospora]
MRVTPQRLAVGLVVLISVGFTVFPVITIARLGGTPGLVVLATCLPGFFVPFFLHLRAALRGAEPGAPTVLLAVQAVAAYAPVPVLDAQLEYLGYWWTGTPTILLGSVLLRLRPPAALGCLVPMAAAQFALGWRYATEPAQLQHAFYQVITLIVTGFVIYGVTRLVVVSRELEQARTQLAEAAVLRERLRISRDLHDGLGSSLTAIALKGDLARRLVGRDPDAAGHELADLVRVARDAAQDVRQVARGYREMSLREEVRRGAALLAASGVEVQANLADLDLARPVDEALAWAVREGITNLVRHSRATTCSISTSRTAGTVRLELVNDGAPERAADGSVPEERAADGTGPTGLRERAADGGGLAGLRERAADGGGLAGLRERAGGLGGSLRAERTPGGGFRLAVEVPA